MERYAYLSFLQPGDVFALEITYSPESREFHEVFDNLWWNFDTNGLRMLQALPFKFENDVPVGFIISCQQGRTVILPGTAYAAGSLPVSSHVRQANLKSLKLGLLRVGVSDRHPGLQS